MKLSHRETIVALDKYLTDLHSQSWPPMQWLILNEDRREDAIDWFVSVCEAIGLIETTEERIERT